MFKKSILAILAILLSGAVYSASVGTAPGSIDIGEVEKGQTIEHQIYVTTNYNEPFTVNPRFSSPRWSTVFAEDRSERSETSELGIEEWVSFEDALVEPNSSFSADLEDGTSVNANGQFTMTIEVPNDAEPGYHYGQIRLNPQIDAEGESQAGTVNWGEITPNFRLRVAGDVNRNIQVQDVRSFRLDENQAAVEVLLTNTGTVTATTENFNIKIYDSSRNEKANLSVSGARLAPGESVWVDGTWADSERIEGGSYEIDGEVDYLTGNSYASGSFSLPDFNVVEVRPDDSPAVDEDERDSIPLWLVFMVLVILTVLMWSFDIEPFWILAIIGGLAVAAFILLTGVSNYLLLILLMMTGIFFYGVM